jgi:hypothetical protein
MSYHMSEDEWKLIRNFIWTDCTMDKILKKNWNRKIHYHSIKEHPNVSKITKFACETV